MTMDRSPHIAVVTNLAPNHLDMHKDMAEYEMCIRDRLDTAVERSFSVAQETPEVSPAPEDLLLYRLCPRLTSCRLVGSKLVLKGERCV